MNQLLLGRKKITSCNILEVEVSTNGLQGGDTGHGGWTVLKLKDLGGTDLNVGINGEDPQRINSVEIRLGGDSELETFREALGFAHSILGAIELLK